MTTIFDLSGRVVVVTGGNSGIGFAMANALAAAGADVAIWGRNEERNRDAVERLTRDGRTALAVRCDVTNEEEVAAAFTQTIDTFGRFDAVFANAGVPGTGERFVDLTLDDWRAVTAVDLDGVFLTFRGAARHMVERGEGGSLVAVASVLALRGEPRAQPYSASKGAVLSMVRSCAVELAGNGIRVNAIVPGYVETPLARPMLEWARFRDRVLPRVPVGRWGRPDDLGGLAVYFASDASAWHTGDAIVIDGGFSAT